MAIHDPESTAQERQLALKIGRQKRIQVLQYLNTPELDLKLYID